MRHFSILKHALLRKHWGREVISAIDEESSVTLRNQLGFCNIYSLCKRDRHLQFSISMREITDRRKSECRHFSRSDGTESSKPLTNLLDFLFNKFCVHGMILKNYEQQPSTNVSVFRKFQKYGLFFVADANLQNKPYSSDTKEYYISLMLIGTLMILCTSVPLF